MSENNEYKIKEQEDNDEKKYNKPIRIIYPTYQDMVNAINDNDITLIKFYLNHLSNRNINELFIYLLEKDNINIEYIKLFLEAGANPNFYYENSFPLKIILFKHPSRFDLMDLLLKNGANINMVDLYRNNIISYCNIHKNIDVKNYLIKISSDK